MSKTSQELLSQPDCWRIAVTRARQVADRLPGPGTRVALAGCGTSLYMAQAMAAWREAAGHGVTDAFAASEMPTGRSYDLVVALSRSGTTTEVIQLITDLGPASRVLAITAEPGTPVAAMATDAIHLPFADESSVVQTRFATTACALWRAHLGHDVSALADAAAAALAGASDGAPTARRTRPAARPAEGTEPGFDLGAFSQFVFLGRGAGAALASEAALKFREAALAWSEAYPAMEFRHGPISVIDEQTLVWSLGELESGLATQISATGATIRPSHGDPMVDLVTVHQAAVTLAGLKGLNPDQPRRLTRSVVLV